MDHFLVVSSVERRQNKAMVIVKTGKVLPILKTTSGNLIRH